MAAQADLQNQIDRGGSEADVLDRMKAIENSRRETQRQMIQLIDQGIQREADDQQRLHELEQQAARNQ